VYLVLSKGIMNPVPPGSLLCFSSFQGKRHLCFVLKHAHQFNDVTTLSKYRIGTIDAYVVIDGKIIAWKP